MKKEHQIYAAAGIVAALGGGVYWRMQAEQKAAKAHAAPSTSGSAAAADLPVVALPAADVTAITKLEIANGDKGNVVLVKKGADWELTAPVKAKANATYVKNLLDNLKELKAKEIVDRTAATYAQYELTEGKGVHVSAFKGADKALELWFGKSGSRGQMARVVGKDGVFTVEKYSSFLYTREAKNWRENSILKVEEGDVSSVEILNKNGKFVVTKSGEKWSTALYLPGKDGKLNEKPEEKWEKYDEGKPKELLRAVKAVTAVDFAGEKDETGLDKPEENGGTIKIAAKDKVHLLKVGKVAKGKDRYLTLDGGDGTVFVVSAYLADWAVADRTKFEKKDDKKDKDKKKDEHEDEPPGLDDLQ